MFSVPVPQRMQHMRKSTAQHNQHIDEFKPRTTPQHFQLQQHVALSVPPARPGYGKRSGPLGQARPVAINQRKRAGGVGWGGGWLPCALQVHAPPGPANRPLGALSGSWGFQWEPNGFKRVPKRSLRKPKGSWRPPAGAARCQSDLSLQPGDVFRRPFRFQMYVF